jgi:hypothetical protein
MNSQPSIEPTPRFGGCIAIGIAAFSLLVGIVLGAWTWFLRDGLGPDSIQSSGIKAWRRFSAEFWPVAVFCLVLFAIAFFIGRRQPSRLHSSTNATGNSFYEATTSSPGTRFEVT